MSKARSLNKEWECVSKGTEVSLNKFVLQHFTSLTLDVQSGLVSVEDRTTGTDPFMVDEMEVEKSF
jgi:hypothetical protein